MHIQHFDDLKFSVQAFPDTHCVEFNIYDHLGKQSDGTYLYGDSMNTFDTMKTAPIYAHGSVKWDGCSNWYFDEQDRVMLHACDKDDVLRLGKILAACYDWASQLCSHCPRCA
jgi:hypothetical protein